MPAGWLETGLTDSEVEARLQERLSGGPGKQMSQSWSEIFRRNAFTRLNFLLVVLGGATLVTGSAPDATFLAIALINTVVGVVQEARAKRSLDTLAIINAPTARLVRGGLIVAVPPEELVVDDMMELGPGDQLLGDGTVVAGNAELDESLITGESEPVGKGMGDQLLSGAWLVSGSLKARVTRAGEDAYANQLAAEARRFSLSRSELMQGINQVLRWLTWLLVVIGPILFVRELQSQPWRIAVRLSVAGLVGMVPEGLVLLTTLAFVAAALRLGRRKVLVQELSAVETLARVDALCVDKTGTLTEGGISFAGMELAEGIDDRLRSEVQSALAALSASPGANATMRAIGAAVGDDDGWEPLEQVPFSSARKWSGATFAGHGTWVIGAPEVIGGSGAVRAHDSGLLTKALDIAERGSRVLILARGDAALAGTELPSEVTVVAVVELHEQLRPDVAGTLSYFAEHDVTVRVISGDSPATVRSLAKRVGLPEADRAVDARELAADSGGFGVAVEENRVFGRVTPDQKRDMVRALQAHGHTVAMTGDGVNDVLALKEADLGVAMGSGSAITRGIAQLVILDDDFDVFPSVVAEGRRVLANIELVASLFLVKNIYSLVLSVAVSITGWPYPFLPRHLTLISAVGIGIPGFFLALAPNDRKFTKGFLRRVLAFSSLAGVLTSAAVLLTYAGARDEGLSGDAARTSAIIVTIVVTLWVLGIVARPWTFPRLALLLAMAGLFVGAYFTPGVSTFFSLNHRPGFEVTLEAIVFGAAAAVLIDLLNRSPQMRRLTTPAA